MLDILNANFIFDNSYDFKINKMIFFNSLEFAKQLDQMDPLSEYRELFTFPNTLGPKAIYFLGNSLGLMPKAARRAVEKELDNWGNYAIDGYVNAPTPWVNYQTEMRKLMANMVGAKAHEVVAMNSLTVNLHLMLASFYKPKGIRSKILCEKKPFSSDQYALQTQIAWHHLVPQEHLIELEPRAGEETLRTEDIIEVINQHADELALVLMGGINYYTGQYFEIEKITAAAHRIGAFCGWDLAHAAGNVQMKLHKWDVDFAVWCNYKYVNAGQGGLGAIFVNERYGNGELNRLAGWWGVDLATRFNMEANFVPAYGADGWQISCSPSLLLAPLKASLEIFEKAGTRRIVKKQKNLTGFLEYVIDEAVARTKADIKIITPRVEEQRGSQLSIESGSKGKALYNALVTAGVVCDWREPSVIRVAPVPLYNTYEEVYRFGQILENALKA